MKVNAKTVKMKTRKMMQSNSNEVILHGIKAQYSNTMLINDVIKVVTIAAECPRKLKAEENTSSVQYRCSLIPETLNGNSSSEEL